jgi:hypothetical protein
MVIPVDKNMGHNETNEAIDFSRRYTMVGSHPIFYVTKRGDFLSWQAVQDDPDLKEIVESSHVNMEAEIYCDETGERIESAYGNND